MERENRLPLIVNVCKDFMKGRCPRSEMECRFAHPTPAMVIENRGEGEYVSVCFDSLLQRCSRGISCRFLHPPPHMVKPLAEKAGINLMPLSPLNPMSPLNPAIHSNRMGLSSSSFYPAPPMDHLNGPPGPILGPDMPPAHELVAAHPRTVSRPALEVCRDFVRGRCSREAEDCRYAHSHASSAAGDPGLVTVCQDFLKGRCERETCRYFHPPEHLRSRIREIRPGGSYASGSIKAAGSVSPARISHAAVGSLMPDRDRINAAAYQAAYNAYAASLYEQQAAAKRMRLEEERAAGGLYGLDMSMDHHMMSAPPDSEMSPFQETSLGPAFLRDLPSSHVIAPAKNPSFPMTESDKMLVCRDFLRGKCARPACRFAHPPESVVVVDQQVTVCRDSLHGRCNRNMCRFYHMPSRHSSPGHPY